MSLRERQRAQRSQLGTSTCSIHPESRLKMKDGEQWCNDCGSQPGLLARVASETERYLTGDSTQHAAIKSKLRKKYGDMEMTNETALVLREPTETDLVRTGQKFESMVAGFGDGISDADLHLAAQLSNAGFLPQHFNVVHGNLYLNYLGATYWTKQSFGLMDGGSSHRPMTADEKDFYKLEDGEVGVVATYHKIVSGTRFEIATDIGRAGGSRDKGKNPIAMDNRPEMAIKRALIRVMRQAAPLGVSISTYDGDIGVIEDAVQVQPTLEVPNNKALEARDESAEFAISVVAGIKSLGELDIEKFLFDEKTGKSGVLAMTRNGTYSVDEIVEAVRLMCLENWLDPETPPAPAEEVPTEDVEELPW